MAFDFLSPCYLDTRLCLQNEKLGTIPGKRRYVFLKLKGRKQVSSAQPPPSPAPSLAPSEVKNSPLILQTHCALSISVPFNRLFSRPLTLFPFSTDKFQIRPILSLHLVNPIALAPHSSSSSRLDCPPFLLSTIERTRVQHGMVSICMADFPGRCIFSTINPPQTHALTLSLSPHSHTHSTSAHIYSRQ